MTEKELTAWIRQLIKDDKMYTFYHSKEWKALRGEILSDNHYECRWCKDESKLSIAETVHHIKEVKQYPWLALSRTYTDADGEHEQLVPLCHDCHDKAHNRFSGQKRKRRINAERW